MLFCKINCAHALIVNRCPICPRMLEFTFLFALNFLIFQSPQYRWFFQNDCRVQVESLWVPSCCARLGSLSLSSAHVMEETVGLQNNYWLPDGWRALVNPQRDPYDAGLQMRLRPQSSKIQRGCFGVSNFSALNVGPKYRPETEPWQLSFQLSLTLR